ncbi:MAG: prepilin peptidase [Clostridiales bacterium]|nr:prepilin peptidase [Clostridiales bacterium]
MEQLEACVLLGFLAAFAWIDYRKKEMPLSLLGVCGAVGILFSRVVFDRAWGAILSGVCVGVFVLLCSLAMKGSVGFADGILFCALGTYAGMWPTLLLLFGATALCGLVGGCLLLTKKCTRKQSLAFAPFVLAAFAGMMVLDTFGSV